MIKSHIVNIAFEFWKLAGGVKNWPCDIQRAVSLLTPLTVVSLTDLSFINITNWLAKRNILVEIEYSNRYLHGFILVHKNCGFIFINGTDSEADRRYTIAHEVSHYFIDYKLPRDKAQKIFGEGITEVLDGYRNPSSKEKVESILASVPIRPYSHILEAEGNGEFLRYSNWISEKDADALALELLAPYNLIKKDYSKYSKKKLDFQECKNILLNILLNKYALPLTISSEYSSIIAANITSTRSIIDRLGLRRTE